MTQKIYVVEGRQFGTEADYRNALKDQQVIENLRVQTRKMSLANRKKLLEVLRSGRCRFHSILGQDYMEELEEEIGRQEGTTSGRTRAKRSPAKEETSTAEAPKKKAALKKMPRKKETPKKKEAAKRKEKVKKKLPAKKKGTEKTQFDEAELDKIVEAELKKQEKRRKLLIFCCSIAAVLCLGYFAVYNWYNYRTAGTYKELSALKDKEPVSSQEQPVIHYTADEDQRTPPPVLDEYKNLLNKNKRLIGWVKIDDTNIDYPVMQTTDNEYYLDHNLNQEYDKNGSIFMDKDCDVLKPSTNFILYGHHMKSGQMFGSLSLYSDQSYYEKHPYIQFDTIYEKGLYEIMYVFRSRVYSEDEIVFKYYQFIDAQSEQEFDSYMSDMEGMSLYDTGVTASFGDQLLTLSTCDYQEKNGRFVVVARKVIKE